MNTVINQPNTKVSKVTKVVQTPQNLSPREAMEQVARAFNATLDNTPEPLLALVVDDTVAVNISAHDGRLAAFCRIADVSQMTTDAWVGMLAEAANWGVDGEATRFTVLKPFVALMWSAPLTKSAAELLDELGVAMSRAVAVARMVRKLQKASDIPEKLL
jgi:hypothetical protein